MKIKEYRKKELEEAFDLQKECLNLHMPPPAVIWWQADIVGEDGIVEERIISKCNSFTRNGLNVIAKQGIYPSTDVQRSDIFGDGIISLAMENGACISKDVLLRADECALVVVGGEASDGIDVYNMQTPSHIGYTNITNEKARTIKSTYFNHNTNRVVSSLQTTHVWANDIVCTQAGVWAQAYCVGGTENYFILAVHDVFQEPVTVQAGKSLVFTYNFELEYWGGFD